jgi:glycosyltransferase involved in cell wall biosynthesis
MLEINSLFESCVIALDQQCFGSTAPSFQKIAAVNSFMMSAIAVVAGWLKMGAEETYVLWLDRDAEQLTHRSRGARNCRVAAPFSTEIRTHLPLLTRLGVPFLTTLHNRLDTPGLPDVVTRFSVAPFISISDDQRRPLTGANWLGTIYHGLPADSLQPSFSAGSYLAFLGRLTPDKGPETAIRLARAAKMPLRIAAKLPRAERGYFKEQVEPLIDGNEIQTVGEVNERNKQNFLANASGLLFPIDWPEPFGLVMIEAMACGTPVIAFRRGSVPEVLEHGVTGFIVEDEEEALQAIKRLPELDRSRVRAGFERRFTARRMAEDYVRHYHMLLENWSGRTTVC